MNIVKILRYIESVHQQKEAYRQKSFNASILKEIATEDY